jgi:hypothetical protein
MKFQDLHFDYIMRTSLISLLFLEDRKVAVCLTMGVIKFFKTLAKLVSSSVI